MNWEGDSDVIGKRSEGGGGKLPLFCGITRRKRETMVKDLLHWEKREQF